MTVLWGSYLHVIAPFIVNTRTETHIHIQNWTEYEINNFPTAQSEQPYPKLIIKFGHTKKKRLFFKPHKKSNNKNLLNFSVINR